MNAKRTQQRTLPVLPLRDVVVFPYMVMPLFVGRAKSISALDEAMNEGKQLLLVSQKQADLEEPTVDDVFDVGTIANIIQLLKLPDGTVKVLVEGQQRAKINQLNDGEDHFSAEVTPIETTFGDEKELDVVKAAVLNEFESYLQLNKKIPADVLGALQRIDDADRLADTMAAHIPVTVRHKQSVLELADVQERLEYLLGMMESEADILQVEKRIRGRVKKQMEKSQRNYYLSEQIKAIRKEMDEGESEDTIDEVQQLRQKVEAAGMPADVREKVESELQKLKMMSAMSAEATVVRSYVEWMLQVPWHKRTKVKKDIAKAQQVLDADHYGLERVKERILEYLAVQARLNKIKGPILCLVGPPGVGKTSLGQSIANATGRKYVRMALGGVRDEAEIRGHRKTYIGALPGKLIQKMAKVGVKNPLFLLDEIDKMSSDYKGDTASAMLEVLDAEQNCKFRDHYIEVPIDLSEVLFIATANSVQDIPRPLLDRMELIEVSSYTENEKFHIAKEHLLPKVKEKNGLKPEQLKISDRALQKIISGYTREAGVRNLERRLSEIARKSAREVYESEVKCVKVTGQNVEKYLGKERYTFDQKNENDEVGIVRGLAWTSVGGDTLEIEVNVMPGKGEVQLTGQLGDVMKESAQAGLSYIRSVGEEYHIPKKFFQENDIHIHIPEGAVPKDGPSAGITMATAMLSAITQTPVRADVAMTGEITLRGRVLPIGGLKEKILAAKNAGIKTICIPKKNEKDVEEISSEIKKGLELVFVEKMQEVLEVAFVKRRKTW